MKITDLLSTSAIKINGTANSKEELISKMVDKYSTITLDEYDATLSPANKEIITEVLVTSMRQLGIGTAYVITHNPENYEKAAVDVGYIVFPGGKLSGKKNKDYVEVS